MRLHIGAGTYIYAEKKEALTFLLQTLSNYPNKRLPCHECNVYAGAF